MALSLTRLCLICSYIFNWHLPSTKYHLLLPPLCIFSGPLHSPFSSRDVLLSLGSCSSLSLATSKEDVLMSILKGSALLWAARAWLQVLSHPLTPGGTALEGLCTS